LSGAIPTQLGSLSNLRQLRLSSNRLDAIPGSIGNLTNLRELNLRGNWFGHDIPTEIGNLSNLTTLDLRRNILINQIPSSLGNLSNLTSLLLGNNRLSGTIPTELGSLTSLTRLGLTGNALTGCVPEGLQNISAIQWNLATLGLPRCHADLAALTAFYNATGGANWTKNTNWMTYAAFDNWRGVDTGANGRVTVLNLAYNGLSGAIPTQLGSLSNLTSLDLANNGLSGAIPTELGSLSNLTSLDLANNGLSGAIPTELGSLSNLTSLGTGGFAEYHRHSGESGNSWPATLPCGPGGSDRFLQRHRRRQLDQQHQLDDLCCVRRLARG
jgi:Leucine-rich repeat (LRR) protein